VGKSFLAEFLKHSLLGSNLVSIITDQETALGKFNDPLIGIVFADIEEFRLNREHNQKLKAIITGDDMTCHPKGLKAYDGVNCINVWMPTNDEGANDVKDFAKRLLSLKIGRGINTPGFEHLKDRVWDTVAIARGMIEWWNNPENGCVDAAGKVVWRPENIPVTVGAQVQKIGVEDKVDPVVAWMRALVAGDTTRSKIEWGKWVSNEKMYTEFANHYVGNRVLLQQWSQNKLTSALKAMFPSWTRKLRKLLIGTSAQSVQLPELSVARSEFYESQNEEVPEAEEVVEEAEGE
jgi:hypothetical protein